MPTEILTVKALKNYVRSETAKGPATAFNGEAFDLERLTEGNDPEIYSPRFGKEAFLVAQCYFHRGNPDFDYSPFARTAFFSGIWITDPEMRQDLLQMFLSLLDSSSRQTETASSISFLYRHSILDEPNLARRQVIFEQWHAIEQKYLQNKDSRLREATQFKMDRIASNRPHFCYVSKCSDCDGEGHRICDFCKKGTLPSGTPCPACSGYGRDPLPCATCSGEGNLYRIRNHPPFFCPVEIFRTPKNGYRHYASDLEHIERCLKRRHQYSLQVVGMFKITEQGVEAWWGKPEDKRKYLPGLPETIKAADPKTFDAFLDDGEYGFDRNHVFYGDYQIPSADRSKFRLSRGKISFPKGTKCNDYCCDGDMYYDAEDGKQLYLKGVPVARRKSFGRWERLNYPFRKASSPDDPFY